MTTTQLTIKGKRPAVLGGFGKGVDSAVSISFGLSGGRHCDTACRHHPDSTAADATRSCYAVKVERLYPTLGAKMVRHEAENPADIVRRGMAEIQAKLSKGKPVAWLRFSVDGSLPQPDEVTGQFVQAMRDILTLCRQNDIPVHLPVETQRKAGFYRAAFGDLVTIRESAQTEERFVSAAGATSSVAGTWEMSAEERVQAARDLAKRRAEHTGRKVAVCPYVAAKTTGKDDLTPFKCGNCTLCARPDVDVIYPLHR